METKINIAAILKDKPVNTKLYSPFYGNCILAFPEDMTIKDKSLVNRYFYDDGRGCLNGEIICSLLRKCVTGLSSHGRRVMCW